LAARARRETFPWTVKNSITEGSDYTKHIDELAVRLEKNKKTEQQTSFQEFNSKNISEMMSDKANKISQPHLHETVDYKNQQHDSSSTIVQYQQIIKSLGTELAEYKNKMELMASEKNQQGNVDSLKAEITEYKSKLNAIQPEMIQYQQIIKSLGTELAEYKNKMELMASEKNQQGNVDSLKAEITEYKSKFNAIQPEMIQYQQIIKSLGTELAEYKNRFSFVPQGVRKEEDISSLRAEISRLKRNLDSMIL